MTGIMQRCSFHSHAERERREEESPGGESESARVPFTAPAPRSIKFPAIKSVSSEQIVFE